MTQVSLESSVERIWHWEIMEVVGNGVYRLTCLGMSIGTYINSMDVPYNHLDIPKGNRHSPPDHLLDPSVGHMVDPKLGYRHLARGARS